ncbi:MAG TPA: CaiB/BaiF CoA-transferase family protein [Candidatus Binataceae bacterium]|nr:CaiB/BaiF CoA-transferase family protein [Candidatus Binataceae bacterium]
MEHALTGLKVLDFSRALAGPSCTRMLVEMGADVIKVEAAPSGDMTRGMSKLRNDRSLYYIQQNRGKKSLCVDLRDPRGMALVTSLIPKVDVVVENFKPGTMQEMGLGYDRLREMKQDIILCSISALGQSGPLAKLPGYDFIAQAYSGATSMIGEAGGTPYIPLVAVGDVNTGVHGALAILAALRYRDHTGKGQHLDVGLLDVYYHCHEVSVHQYSGSNGQLKPSRQGPHLNYVAPAGVFKANGGWIVIMSFLHHWKDLCKAMNRPDLVTDQKMGTDAGRLANRAEMIKLIEDWLATFPDRDSAVEHMQKNAVPCAPVLSIEETVSHPHLRARGTVRTVEDPIAGKFEIPGFPLRFSAIPEPLPLETPTLGQHNDEILRDWLGRSNKEIAELREKGVLVEGRF